MMRVLTCLSLMRRRTSQNVDKRAANVRIRRDLLAAAREAGVDLSATLERALMEELAEARCTKWRQENRAAIAIYNDYVEKHGMVSDGVRFF
jgi:antitoxin CcdA